MSISVTGYCGLDREWILRLCRQLGAKFGESFSKADSLLIASSTEGPKYLKAIEWKIPVVTNGWLYAVLKTRTLPKTQDFTVKPSSHHVFALKNPPPLFREPTPRPKSVSMNTRSKTPQRAKPSKSSVLATAKKTSPKSNAVLEGCVIGMSARLQSRRNEVMHLTAALGAEFASLFTSQCTHLIHAGSESEVTQAREYVSAKRQNKLIVHLQWLRDCQAKSQRLKEEDYPYTLGTSSQIQGDVKPSFTCPCQHPILSQSKGFQCSCSRP